MHLVLVVGFGAQYVQLIVRHVHEVNICSEIIPHTMSVADTLAREPAAIILSDGPSSMYEEDAPSVDPVIFKADVLVLGIYYGFQTMVHALGGTVGCTGAREYGHTEATMVSDSCLFGGTPDDQIVWMSRGDAVQGAPEGFIVTALTTETPAVAFESRGCRLYGLRWHLETGHSQFGQDALKDFLYEGAGLEPTWAAGSIMDEQVAKIREQADDTQVIYALSGGVDSSVVVALVHRAVGDQLTCFFTDHSLLCVGEREQMKSDCMYGMGIRVITCNESGCLLPTLAGVTEPEMKRKITSRKFIRSFEAAQKQVIRKVGVAGGEVRPLVQGTLYPNVVESGGDEGAANIKSRHNMGDLSEDMTFGLVEPLYTLFEDEVRAVGRELGLSDCPVNRQPFLGPGLDICIIGKITRERLDILQAANLIAHKELTVAGLDQEIWQYLVVLLTDVRPVNVRGDGRIYGYPVVLRPIPSEDAMTADWTCLPYDILAHVSTRITNSVPEVNRVVLDVISRPSATIERK